jgi:hypothetical protein
MKMAGVKRKDNMGRYLVFVGNLYYPNGGANDFDFATNSLEEAVNSARQDTVEDGWANVLDAETGQVVANFGWDRLNKKPLDYAKEKD